MAMKTEMTTLSGILEKLRMKRMDNEFIFSNAGFSTNTGKSYQPEDLIIIKTYRFEGDSNPSDASILYVIEANDGLTGYSIAAYGVYSNHEGEGYDDFIRKLKVADREEQEIFQ